MKTLNEVVAALETLYNRSKSFPFADILDAAGCHMGLLDMALEALAVKGMFFVIANETQVWDGRIHVAEGYKVQYSGSTQPHGKGEFISLPVVSVTQHVESV